VTEHLEPAEPLAPAEPARPAEPFEQPSGSVSAPGTSAGRAIVLVTMGFAAAGVVIGAWWAWIAPSINAVVAITRSGERVHDYLGNESQDFFIAPSMMLGLLSVLAVAGSVLVWQWRDQRGPGMVVGLSIGSVAGAAVAAAVGVLLVRLRYGALNFDAIPLSSDHRIAYVVQAPPVFFAQAPLHVAATLVWPAATAALVYAVLAAANARDDLGGRPVPERQFSPQPVAPEASVS
jgi:Protein of unknown function (DUF2567)